MDIGYARVSTGEQSLDLQLDAMHKAGRGAGRLQLNRQWQAVEPPADLGHGRGEDAHADQGAGQVEQALEQVRSPLVPHTEAPTAEQPGEGALHDPAVPP